jgi:hypothetical protein
MLMAIRRNTVTITISIDPQYGIVVTPPTLTLDRKSQDVEWQCIYPFAVQFKAQSPMKDVSHKPLKPTTGPRPDRVQGKTRPGALPGVYPYLVAVAVPDSQGTEVYIYGSPDIIIRDK